MTSKRRTYREEFKREAVHLWETTNKSAAAVEFEIGITSGLLNKWKARLKADGELAFSGRGPSPQDERRKLAALIISKAVSGSKPPCR